MNPTFHEGAIPLVDRQPWGEAIPRAPYGVTTGLLASSLTRAVPSALG
jgi:hypothetical protein